MYERISKEIKITQEKSKETLESLDRTFKTIDAVNNTDNNITKKISIHYSSSY